MKNETKIPISLGKEMDLRIAKQERARKIADLPAELKRKRRIR